MGDPGGNSGMGGNGGNCHLVYSLDACNCTHKDAKSETNGTSGISFLHLYTNSGLSGTSGISYKFHL
jgi:hypothetical protein